MEFSRPLERDDVVDGLPCSAKFHLWHYPNGRLSVCVLSASTRVRGRDLERWTRLVLSPDGDVVDELLLNVDPAEEYMQRVHGAVEVSWED